MLFLLQLISQFLVPNPFTLAGNPLLPRFLLLLLSLHGFLFAQDADILINHDLYQYVQRLEIQGYHSTPFYSHVKPYDRIALSRFLKESESTELSDQEYAWHQRVQHLVDDSIANRSSSKGIWNAFFLNGRDFFHVDNEDFQLYVNPALNLGLGFDNHTFNPGERNNDLMYNNIRGLKIRGSLLNKIGFYASVEDNIINLPQFIYGRFDSTRQLYGESFVKPFKERGVDFFSARGYLTFSPIPQLRIKAGKDRVFWGDGYQSIILSDYAPDQLFLQLHTRIWKFSYVNHFTELRDYIPGKSDSEGTHPKKYAVFHQLSFQPWKTLHISIFEGIIYNPIQPSGPRGFELGYLNPVIFYRTVEQSLGSPDNAFIGFGLKYNAFRRLQVYGQLLFDDLNIGRRNDGDGYWGNKFGYQLGLRYINVLGVPTLDFQAEYNSLRPFLYQHFNIVTNYAHYDQSLGHPAGGNLSDLHLILNYHPLPPLNLSLIYSQMEQGLDIGSTNFGGNINRSYAVNRVSEFGNTIGQGRAFNMTMLQGRASWQIGQTDIFAELEGRYRKENELQSVSLLGGLRFGLPQRQVKF